MMRPLCEELPGFNLIRTLIRRPTVAVLLIGMISVGTQPSLLCDELILRPEEYSNEELFHGIILAHGPVARLVPELADVAALQERLPPESAALLRGPIERFHQRLIQAIRKEDPRFFESFGGAVRSGDHLRIASTLRHARTMCLSVLSRMPEVVELRRRLETDRALRAKVSDELKKAAERKGSSQTAK